MRDTRRETPSTGKVFGNLGKPKRPEGGRWGGSIVEDDGLIAVFGACTLP